MRYELNFDEDKVNDVLVVGGASYDLKGCCDIMNEQQSTIEQLKSENKKLQCINDQLEERLESSGIGVALKMDCDMNDRF